MVLAPGRPVPGRGRLGIGPRDRRSRPPPSYCGTRTCGPPLCRGSRQHLEAFDRGGSPARAPLKRRPPLCSRGVMGKLGNRHHLREGGLRVPVGRHVERDAGVGSVGGWKERHTLSVVPVQVAHHDRTDEGIRGQQFGHPPQASARIQEERRPLAVVREGEARRVAAIADEIGAGGRGRPARAADGHLHGNRPIGERAGVGIERWSHLVGRGSVMVASGRRISLNAARRRSGLRAAMRPGGFGHDVGQGPARRGR